MPDESLEDEYHTRCKKCKIVKENYLFFPSMLKKGQRCRKCMKENYKNRLDVIVKATNSDADWKSKKSRQGIFRDGIKGFYKRKDQF